MAQQRTRVPQFGNWEGDSSTLYTVCFDNASKGRVSGAKMNPNDPEENPDASMFGRVEAESDGAIVSDPAAGRHPPRVKSTQSSDSEEKSMSRGHSRTPSPGSQNIGGNPRSRTLIGGVQRRMPSEFGSQMNGNHRRMHSEFGGHVGQNHHRMASEFGNQMNGNHRRLQSDSGNHIGGSHLIMPSEVDQLGGSNRSEHQLGGSNRSEHQLGGSNRSTESGGVRTSSDHSPMQQNNRQPGSFRKNSIPREVYNHNLVPPSLQGPDPMSRSASNRHIDMVLQSSRPASVPKFGAWDESDPHAGQGFSVIFNKVKEEKQLAASKFSQVPPKRSNNTVDTSKKDAERKVRTLY